MSKELYLFFAAEIFLNVLTFILFYVDQQAHRRHPHHPHGVPSHILLTLAVLGGSLGELLGIIFLHHKRHHKEFTITLPILFVVQVTIIVTYLMGYFSDVVTSDGLVPA